MEPQIATPKRYYHEHPCHLCGVVLLGSGHSPGSDLKVVSYLFVELNQRGVFSGPANLSRLKTQLALEASKT